MEGREQREEKPYVVHVAPRSKEGVAVFLGCVRWMGLVGVGVGGGSVGVVV